MHVIKKKYTYDVQKYKLPSEFIGHLLVNRLIGPKLNFNLLDQRHKLGLSKADPMLDPYLILFWLLFDPLFSCVLC